MKLGIIMVHIALIQSGKLSGVSSLFIIAFA